MASIISEVKFDLKHPDIHGSMNSEQLTPEQCRIHQTELNKKSIEQIQIQQLGNLTYVLLNKNHLDQLQIYQIVN